MKKTILISLILFGLMSCKSKIEGEGPARFEQEFETDIFGELEISCNCDVTLIPSENTKIVVESHQNLIDNLQIDSKRKKLKISEKNKVKKYSLYNLNIYFNSELSKVELKDQSKLKISGTLKAEKMEFKTSGNSIINDAFVDIDKFKIETKDNSNVYIKGTAIDLNVDTGNESIVDLFELQSVDVNFKAKDNSNLSVSPMKNLKGTAVDNSVVNYKGDPNKDATAKDKSIIEKK